MDRNDELTNAKIADERRHLTVMFCDIVDSTTFSRKLDPEDYYKLIDDFQRVCSNAVQLYGGFIAQYAGDSVLIYFGYPAAREDDPIRAVNCALQILKDIKSIRVPSLNIRIGIHTGLVLLTELASETKRGQLAIGDVPYIAASIQKLAYKNEIIITVSTYELIEGYFICKKIRARTGVEESPELYRVIEPIQRLSRFEINIMKGLTTPFVGRREELSVLDKCWEKTKTNNKQVVLIEGEAGIGKSRIVHEFKNTIISEPNTYFECQCWETKSNTPFSPVYENFKRLINLSEGDDDENINHKIDKLFDTLGLNPHTYTSILLPLFSSEYQKLHTVPNATSEKMRRDTLEKIIEFYRSIAKKRPLIIFIEDIHWSDPSTKELLNHLIEGNTDTKIFIILTFRPEFTATWQKSDSLVYLTLHGLDRHDTKQMIQVVSGGKLSSEKLTNDIAQKSDGVPLFIEEITKVVESQASKGNDSSYADKVALKIPTSLNDYLMARLDSLGDSKVVAQLGSVFGREFNLDYLLQVINISKELLGKYISKLIESEITFMIGPTECIFKHALIQDAAYNSITKNRRIQYHKDVANLLEERLADEQDVNLEVLASHFEKAAMYEKAVSYWSRAARTALDHSANLEAENFANRGLSLISKIQDKDIRIKEEINLMTILGPTVMALEGFVSPRVRNTYEKGIKLCRRSKGYGETFPLLVGLSWYYHLVGNFQYCREILSNMFKLADQTKDYDKYIWSYCLSGALLYMEGEIRESFENIESALNYHKSDKKIDSYGYYDPIILSTCYRGLSLWAQGYPDKGLRQNQDCEQYAEIMDDPFNNIWATYFLTLVYQHRLDYESTFKKAYEFKSKSKEQAMPYFFMVGTMLYLWAQTKDEENIDSIIPEYKNYLESLRSTGVRAVIPYFDILLGELYVKTNQIEQGQELINNTMANVLDTEQKLFLPEVLRVRGDLLLQKDINEAKRCYSKAINISREIGSKSYELRSTIQLCRLLKNKGQQKEAARTLTKIYSHFTEGYDTGDLREAKNLLDQLS